MISEHQTIFGALTDIRVQELLNGNQWGPDEYQEVLDQALHPDWQARFAAATIEEPFVGPRQRWAAFVAPMAYDETAYLPILNGTELIGWQHPATRITNWNLDHHYSSARNLFIGPDVRIENIRIGYRWDSKRKLTYITRFQATDLTLEGNAIILNTEVDHELVIHSQGFSVIAAAEMRSRNGTGVSNSVVTRTQFQNGSYVSDSHLRCLRFPTHTSSLYAVNADGNPHGTLSFVVNNAEAFKATKTLTAIQDRLRAGLNLIPDPSGHITLYKRVNLYDNEYEEGVVPTQFRSDYDSSFIYTVGEVAEVTDIANYYSPGDSCAPGLHVSTPDYWHEGSVLLTCKVHVDDIITLLDGKARVRKLLVLGAQPWTNAKTWDTMGDLPHWYDEWEEEEEEEETYYCENCGDECEEDERDEDGWCEDCVAKYEAEQEEEERQAEEDRLEEERLAEEAANAEED